MGTLWQDVKYGARMLRRSSGFLAVAVLTLALGIGANTAIFQLLDAVRLRRLPVQNPQELVEIRIADMTGARGSFDNWNAAATNPLWEQIRDQQRAFSGSFAWGDETFNIAQQGEARPARGLWVSGDFFNVLGVRPILGRVFTRADDQRGCASPGAVISYSFWQREYGGENAIIGRRITLEGHPLEIIGVTPANFFGLEIGRSFDVAVPICSEPMFRGLSRLDAGTFWWLTVMGRLKPGWSLEQASAHLHSISPGIFAATLAPNYPSENVQDYLGYKLKALPAGSGVSQLRATYSDSLWILLAIAGLVLLIACLNLTNLMLVRASARQREIAIRLALGATRGRLVRQLLAESMLLVTLGAACGALLAPWLSQYLISFFGEEGNPVFVNLDMDWRVLAFTAALAAFTCILFGLTPALRATRIVPGAVMKEGGRGMSAGHERFGLRRTLVISQVALSFVLLVGALLFSLTLRNLLNEDAGFQQDGMLITYLDLTRLKLPVAQWNGFKAQLLERMRAVPGVDSAAHAKVIPISGSASDNHVWMEGADAQQRINPYFNWISPGYFKTMAIPLLGGRDFDSHDAYESPRVAIVNEAFARRLGIAENPVGRRFRREATPFEPERVFEIVGLVKNSKYRDLREDFTPIAFLAATQIATPEPYLNILIRSNVPIDGLVQTVNRTLSEANPQIVFNFRVFKTQVRESLLRERLMAMLSGFFGFLAALLATIGLYGVMAYLVVRRTNEIGIRMALGADPGSIARMILREAALLLVIGLAVGTVLSLAAAQAAGAMLFGLKPHDPLTMVMAAILLAAAATAASYLPARRASRVEPVVALRYE